MYFRHVDLAAYILSGLFSVISEIHGSIFVLLFLRNRGPRFFSKLSVLLSSFGEGFLWFLGFGGRFSPEN